MLKPGNIDGHAIALGFIHHIECNDYGDFKLTKFQQKAQMQPKVGCRNNANQKFGAFFSAVLSQADISRDVLIRARRGQTVSTRKIQNADRATLRRGEKAFFSLDSDTSVVRYFLTASGQLVEKRSLAAVRVSNKGSL